MKLKYLVLIGLLTACGEQNSIDSKKAQLDELKGQLVTLNEEIQALEEEIKTEDPDYAEPSGLYTLVSTMTLEPQAFEHKFEVRASVASRKNVQISAEAMGRVERIYVREGDKIRKGQQLLNLDGAILQNSIAELQTSLDLAQTVFEKRARLWKQNIGSEIQYLEAKNNKESLERRLATSQSQLRQYRIVAPFSGVVDEVQAKQGEMAQPGIPLMRIVSVDEMHIEADVSESYLGNLQAGDSVELYFPSFEKEMLSIVASIGQVINTQNRTFSIEVVLPASEIPYKPNLVAILKIRDYYQRETVVVPSGLIQQDNQGDYVYTLTKEAEELKAKKVHISLGKSYNSRTEVLNGIDPGVKLIKEGHRDVTDGALVQLAERETL